MEPEIGGDPATGRRFVRLSLRELGRRLHMLRVPSRRLLGKSGFSLRVNVKRFTGPPHPDRDKQFRYFRRQRKTLQRTGNPVLSVDAKKKEFIGEFQELRPHLATDGREKSTPTISSKTPCSVLLPTGFTIRRHNRGHVHVGHETAIRPNSPWMPFAPGGGRRDAGCIRRPDAC